MSSGKTLEQLAMEYAIASLGVDPDKLEGVFDLKPTVTGDEWAVSDLYDRMCRQFGVYETCEAIHRAKQIVLMVIPNQGS